jgi:hypothetical protein
MINLISLMLALTRNLESHNILKLCTVNTSAAKHIHVVLYQCRSVVLSRRRRCSDALQFRPATGGDIKAPCVIVVELLICPTEAGTM